MKFKKIVYWSAAVVIVLPLLALAALCFKYKMGPIALFNKATSRLVTQNTSADYSASSIFLQLNVSRNKNHTIPVSERGSGGAITSFGDELIVMNHLGEIFKILPDDITKLDIEAAPNNIGALREISKTDKYKDYWHRFNLVRYNDIMVMANGGDANLLLISYTEWNPSEECYVTAIAKLAVSSNVTSLESHSAKGEDWEVIFRTNPCLPLKKLSAAIDGHMAGGRMTLSTTGKLLIGSGDYAWDGLYAEEAVAQDRTNSYGKIMEIDVDDGSSEQLSYGHRNMQGIALDREGKIWVIEHGPRGGDELNMSVPDGNFGWPLETLGTRYNALPWPGVADVGRHDQFIQPKIAWVPSIAPSSMIRLENFHPTWDGDFLVGTFRTGSIHRVRIQNEQVVFVEPVKILDGRIRDLHQHSDGSLIVWTDDKTILIVTASETTTTDTVIDDFLEVANYSDEVSAKIKSAMGACVECHSLDGSAGGSAPSLGGIHNGNIGQSTYTNYSEALKNTSGKWTSEKLTSYLTSPQAVIPGTSMPETGLSDPVVVEGIVEVLKLLRSKY